MGAALGPIAALGVASTGSYAAGLVRHLRSAGLSVLGVNQPHAHTRRRRGKSDPIDAEMAARHVLAVNSIVIAKDTTGIVEAIRQLRVARAGAIMARSAAVNALTDPWFALTGHVSDEARPVHLALVSCRRLASVGSDHRIHRRGPRVWLAGALCAGGRTGPDVSAYLLLVGSSR